MYSGPAGLLSRLPLPFKHLPPLRHHVRVQYIASRHVDEQDNLEQYINPCPLLGRRLQSQIHKQTLAGDADGIQHKKSIIPQPRQKLGDVLADGGLPDEEPVPNDLRDAPGKEDARERNRTCGGTCRLFPPGGCGGDDLGVSLEDNPDDEDARGDLHGGRDGAGAHEAHGSVHNLEEGDRLCPFQKWEERVQ